MKYIKYFESVNNHLKLVKFNSNIAFSINDSNKIITTDGKEFILINDEDQLESIKELFPNDYPCVIKTSNRYDKGDDSYIYFQLINDTKYPINIFILEDDYYLIAIFYNMIPTTFIADGYDSLKEIVSYIIEYYSDNKSIYHKKSLSDFLINEIK